MAESTQEEKVDGAVEDWSQCGRLADSLAQSRDRTLLERTIEQQIIPRLMMVHRGENPAALASPAEADARLASMPDEVSTLSRLVIGRDGDAAFSYVQAMRERGMTLDAIYLQLLAPTARILGDMWTSDMCDFTDVTVGLWRLQQVVHKLSGGFTEEPDTSRRERRLLLVPEPGEQHTFGLIMVAEFFRRDGWDVWDGPISSRQELISLVQREAFAVVGLSVGVDSRLDDLATTIRLIRQASRNPAVSILVGGQPFLAQPERVQQVGADGTAIDGQQAVTRANALQPSGHKLRS